MLPFLKRAAERTLIASGLAALGRRRQEGRLLVLAYHNILGPGEPSRGERSLHLPIAAFRGQLDLLQRHCELVSLGSVLAGEALMEGRPTVIVTFDDAYHGAVEHGLGELAARGLPCVMFVAPGLLDQGGFWWDALAGGHGTLPWEVRDACLDELGGWELEVRRAAPARGWTVADTGMRAATFAELRAAARAGRVEIGAHSWGHPNLARLSSQALQAELTRPLSWLREHLDPHSLPVVAYPYGLSSAGVRQAAEAAGYAAGFMIDGGWTSPRPEDPFAFPRFNVPAGLSLDGFRLRLAGWGVG